MRARVPIRPPQASRLSSRRRGRGVPRSAVRARRPDTPAAGLAAVKPAKGPGFTITGGNASQLSDGASAAVIMSDKLASQKGLNALGIFRGFVSAGRQHAGMA